MALADTARLVASLELQDKFSGPARGINRSIGGLERSTGRLGRVGSEAGRGLSRLGANLTTIGVIAGGVVAGGLIASIGAASDLNEEIDKSKVVFGEAAAGVISFAKGAASIGLATSEALGAAGAFGNMFNTIGLAADESADMSVRMVQLASDMASFNNEDPNEMLLKLRSGLAGEAEPLRRFGVLLSEAAVKEFAFRTGIAATGATLTEAQKVQARYGLILEQTAIQQGNFADTSESVANQQRILRANLKNTGAVIGTAFLPSLSRLSAKLNEVFIDKQPQIAAFAERLGASLERVFSNQNIDRGMASVSGFIDRLSTGDVSGAFSGIGTVVSSLAGLPWASIGDAARLLGTGAKFLLSAFLGLPPWVQTAVLTGWGLNKLTGGALGNIIGELGKGLIKGVLGMNAGVVNINAGIVNGGGGVPTPGGRGVASGLGGLGGLLTKAIVSAGGILLTIEAGRQTAEFLGGIGEMSDDLGTRIDALPRRNGEEIGTSISRVEAALAAATDGPLNSMVTTLSGVRGDLQAELRELIRLRDIAATRGATIDASIGAAAQADHRDTAIVAARIAAVETSIGTAAQADRTDAATATARLAAIHTSIGTAAAADHADTHSAAKAAAAIIDSSIGSAAQSDHADAVAFNARIDAARERIVGQVAASGAAQLARQDAIAGAVRTNTAVLGAKNFAPDIHVTTHVTSNVSISEIQRRITSQQIAMTTSSGLGGGI